MRFPLPRWTALAALALVLPACGDDAAPEVEIPAWAKFAPEQIAEAKRHGVPVAFENDLGMRFVLIPAGTFMMGSPENEEYRDDDETQHEVVLTKPFYMQTTEVTNGQYRRWKPSHHSGGHKEHSLNGGAQPVVRVSWEMATGFAFWLTGRERGRTYRLPTEAEWEHACRAGTTTRFSFGDREEGLVGHANLSDRNHPSFRYVWDFDDGYAVTAPVGSYGPNGWGLYDLHGNVWEWCSDRYGSYPPGRVTNPIGAASGSERVLRGGSWRHNPSHVRSAFRLGHEPGGRVNYYGFRVVVPLPEG